MNRFLPSMSTPSREASMSISTPSTSSTTLASTSIENSPSLDSTEPVRCTGLQERLRYDSAKGNLKALVVECHVWNYDKSKKLSSRSYIIDSGCDATDLPPELYDVKDNRIIVFSDELAFAKLYLTCNGSKIGNGETDQNSRQYSCQIGTEGILFSIGSLEPVLIHTFSVSLSENRKTKDLLLGVNGIFLHKCDFYSRPKDGKLTNHVDIYSDKYHVDAANKETERRKAGLEGSTARNRLEESFGSVASDFNSAFQSMQSMGRDGLNAVKDRIKSFRLH